MNLDDLLKSVDHFDAQLKKYYRENLVSKKENVYARTVKLTEELGEFCSEILAFNNDQRKSKLEKSNKEKLQDEFADVVISTFLLAKSMNIDPKIALRNKIKKINKRFLEMGDES